ncbi:MAG TPA: hypothetical protein VGL95_14725 [Acetobacteraceae bacterium]|jgi:hypothetical protein
MKRLKLDPRPPGLIAFRLARCSPRRAPLPFQVTLAWRFDLHLRSINPRLGMAERERYADRLARDMLETLWQRAATRMVFPRGAGV